MSTLIRPQGIHWETRPAGKGESQGLEYTERPFSEKELKAIGSHVTEEVCRRYGYMAVESCTVVEGDIKLSLESSENGRIHVLARRGSRNGWLHFPDEKPGSATTWARAGLDPIQSTYGFEELAKQAVHTYNGQTVRTPQAVWCDGTHAALEAASLGLLPLWKLAGDLMPEKSDIVTALKHTEKLLIPFRPHTRKEWEEELAAIAQGDLSGCMAVRLCGDEEGKGGAR